ncbi:MAG TPA: flavodoxin domain-containing protein [Casimicrobiaceae bacterium]|jgi:menaquinone-dependent protoporphyrinogen oxidase|nr:flavodoxin domain-containing protein [Casimicrobiaceae bacterium]
MRPVAVFYATREGHTRRIAERVAATLRQRGLDAVVGDVRARQAALPPGPYAGVVVAASVHAGRHESEMIRFVAELADEISGLRAASS